MFRKWKLLTAVAFMTALMLIPSVLVYAVEASEVTIEVPGGEKRHTVVAYGKSVAIIYPDGKAEIIANNPSGKMDVMIDGKVTKGIGIVVIPAQNGTNMVLEEGSFIVNGISDSQADALKKMVANGLAEESPIASAAVIEGGNGMQGVRAFSIGIKGELFAADGSKVSASALPEMQVKTPEVVYQAFAEEMEESIRLEQEALQRVREEENAARGEEEDVVSVEEENSSNGVTGMCLHEWESFDIDRILISGYDSCATAPFYKCTKCGIVRYQAENVHKHGEDYCGYCGYNVHGERAEDSSSGCIDGAGHTYEGISGMLVSNDYKQCWTENLFKCTKCGYIDPSNATGHEHGDDYCQYCGYNQSGERNPDLAVG